MTTIAQQIPPRGEGPFIAGDTLIFDLTVTDDDGTAYDLTGADVEFTMSPYRDLAPVVTETRSGGVTVTDATNGELRIRVDGADTKGLGDPDGKEYPFDVTVTDDVGAVTTVTIGTIVVTAPASEG